MSNPTQTRYISNLNTKSKKLGAFYLNAKFLKFCGLFELSLELFLFDCIDNEIICHMW